MAHTKVTKNGTQNTGTANTFSYSGSFNVFKASEVEVELDNVALTFTTSTINESASPREYTVDFTNKEVHIGGANLTSSNSVVIQPVTDMGAPTPRATYAPGASVTSEDLNNNQLQLMRKAMEYDEQKLSSRGGTMTGNLHLAKDIDISFEGDTDNAHEITLTVADPTSDKTITLPDTTGTVVTTGDTGTVATGMIAADAVTGAKIADDQINSEHYVDGSIDTAHIGNAQVTADKLGNDSVITAKIQNSAVTTVKIADSNVTTAKIADSNVTTAKIADDGITNAKIGDNAVRTNHIFDGQVTTGKIADLAITTARLANDSVTSAKIGDDQINSEHYVAGSIDHEHLANDIIDGDNIQDDVINSEHYVDGSIDAQHLAADSVITAKIQNGAVTTAKIADDAVTDAKIADNAVVTSTINAQAVTTTRIANLAIDDTKLASNAITESKITDANVTTNKIANDAVTIGKIGCEQTTISDSDSHIPTSGAVVDYVAAQIAPIGGLEVIATDAAFPNTQPQSGVVISIADAGGLVVNSSGTSTTGRTVGGSTVTINNINSQFNSTTVDAGVSFMVSSTGSGQIYNYHKATLKEADLLNLSGDINDFAERYRVSADPDNLPNKDEGDLVYDTNANKMKVYDNSTSAWKEVTSTGDFKYLFLCPAGGSGAPTLNGSIATYDLRESSNSGSAASITNAAQLLVSVNGVVQKANTGTSAPAEGFALVDANTIVFGANLESGDSVFIVQIGSAVSIPTPGDGTVSAAKIASGAVEQAKIADGAVATAKIADNAVTGAKIADNLDIPDNNTIRLGSGNDLSLFHNGTNSHIHSATGELDIRSDDFHLRNAANNENMIVASANGSVELYHDNVKKLETTSDGIEVSGNIFGSGKLDLPDNAKLLLGTSDDLEIYHDGTHSYISEIGTGVLRITADTGVHIRKHNNENIAQFNANGNVEIYHDNSKKLETTSSGITVTGTVTATSFSGDGSNLTGVSSVGGATGVDFNDGVFARFGTGNDLILYHNGNDGQLANSTGNLILANSTDGEIFIDPKNNERGIVVKPDAEVELYYNNTVQFETRDGGATTPGWFASGINAQLNGAKGTFANDGTHLSCRSFATGGYDSIIFRSANTTVGKVFFNSGGTQYHTSSDYRRKENIVDLTGAIDRVKTLQPKRFNFKTETDVTRDGFLAHEVTAVPEAIQGTKDQVATEKDVEDGKAEAVGDPIYQTIDQSALVPLLSAALKEAIAKIEVLETKVAALEAA